MVKNSSNSGAFVQPIVPKFDGKLKYYLYQAISREIMETIFNDDTSKQMWDSMKQKFKGLTRVKRAQLQALKTEFEILRMKEGETVNAYFRRTLSIAKKMKACRENVKEADITRKILRSLVPKFNYVVCSIEESNNVETLTVDELQSSLLIHEQRITGPIEKEQVLKVSNKDRGGKGRGRGKHSIDKAIVDSISVTIWGIISMNVPIGKRKLIIQKLMMKTRYC
ncbi:hypothetical protein J1N35_011160 [Gossypium stocksii]|uniref:Retrovirus-related Pol polyprotein from transposon TNT 1-94 n=1 Tax=Gossypium stocksii TaxID=47602 RepID=A0A9D3W2A7_9ROSI|nr:hypothetical protein J1N35_011160 [Gossypium stocksii]